MEAISKTRMELAIKILERRAAQSEGAPTFRGITITTEHFDAEHLVMLCRLFADEWGKSQERYIEALGNSFPNYIAGGCETANLIKELRKAHKKNKWKWRKPLQPTLWRKIWKWIKG